MRKTRQYSDASSLGIVCLAAMLAGCAGGDIYEERVTYENGVARECGEGPGLQPCRDYNGETYAEETDPNYVGLDSNEDLEKSAAEIREESPEALERTIEGLEQGN
jgi:hypothetical protein